MKLLDYLYIKKQFKRLIKKKIDLVSIPLRDIVYLNKKQSDQLIKICLENNIAHTFNQLTDSLEYKLF